MDFSTLYYTAVVNQAVLTFFDNADFWMLSDWDLEPSAALWIWVLGIQIEAFRGKFGSDLMRFSRWIGWNLKYLSLHVCTKKSKFNFIYYCMYCVCILNCTNIDKMKIFEFFQDNILKIPIRDLWNQTIFKYSLKHEKNQNLSLHEVFNAMLYNGYKSSHLVTISRSDFLSFFPNSQYDQCYQLVKSNVYK